MKEYQKPVVTLNESVAEGVFMASGAVESDCWTINVVSCQDWNGWAHVFEVHMSHPATLHISDCSTATITFNAPIVEADSEFPCRVSGNALIVSRKSLANAYNSGDEVTYKVYVSTGDEATTKMLSISNATVVCDKAVNVQGGF